MTTLFRRAGAKVASFIASLVDPAAVAGQIQKYAKAVDSVVQEFARDSGGTIYQMTPPGIVGGNTISPASLGAGTTDDYAPTGLRNATLIRQDMSGTNTLTGLDATVAGGAGRRITIVNIGTITANQLVIANENASSAAANRFVLPGGADFRLAPGGAITFEYDATSSRWRPLGIATALVPQTIITPASLGSDQNNYNPTGLAGATIIRQDVSGGVELRGLVAQPPNTIITICNIHSSASPEYLVIMHEHGSATAANRFTLPAGNDWYIPPGGAETFIYDATTSRWLMLSFAGNNFPESSASGGPGVTVGYPVELVGLRRESSQVIAMQAGASARQTWDGSGSDPRPVTLPTVSYWQQSSQMRWSAVQAIGALSGTVDNQSISDTTLTARITTSAPVVLTGMTGGAAGRVITIVNASANTITINSEGAGSTAANRFLLSTAAVVIAAEGTAQFWYDTTNSRWRRLSGI